jgi:uncharacterized protein (TIGR02217 family)
MFLEERLSCPNVGSSYGDAFAVQVSETLVNRYAVLRHPFVTSRFSLLFGNQTMEDQLAKTLDFFHRCGGMAGGFRFKHYADFSTNNYTNTPTQQDGPLDQVGNLTYYLTRWFGTPGSTTPRRRIKKPVVDSILLSVFNGSIYTTLPGSAYTFNAATGLITLDSPLSSFETLYGGCYYDIPVMFETDLSDVEWQGAEIMSTNINLVETLNPENL